MLTIRAAVRPASRLLRSYAAAAPRPDVENHAESSTFSRYAEPEHPTASSPNHGGSSSAASSSIDHGSSPSASSQTGASDPTSKSKGKSKADSSSNSQSNPDGEPAIAKGKLLRRQGKQDSETSTSTSTSERLDRSKGSGSGQWNQGRKVPKLKKPRALAVMNAQRLASALRAEAAGQSGANGDEASGGGRRDMPIGSGSGFQMGTGSGPRLDDRGNSILEEYLQGHTSHSNFNPTSSEITQESSYSGDGIPASGSAFASAESSASPSSSSSSSTRLTQYGPPTFSDLLAKKPTRAPNPSHDRYPRQWQHLYDQINQAFVLSQLKGFAAEMRTSRAISEEEERSGLRSGSGSGSGSWSGSIGDLGARASSSTTSANGKSAKVKGKNKKRKVIASIMEEWGWVLPETEKSAKVPQIQRDFALTRHELYFLRSNRELLLEMTMRRGISLSMAPAVDPAKTATASAAQEQGQGFASIEAAQDTSLTTLRAVGREDALESFEEELSRIRNNLVREDVQIDSDAPALPELISMISRITSTYITQAQAQAGRDTPQDSVEVWGLDPTNVQRAVSLILQAGTRLAINPTRDNVIIGNASSTNEIAYFPHLPSSSSLLPWHEASTFGKSLFRPKTIHQWAATHAGDEQSQREVKMSEMSVMSLAGAGAGGRSQKVLLKDWIGNTPGKSVTATFGHLVYVDFKATSPLATPSNTVFTLTEAPKALEGRGRPIFLPAMPSSVLINPLTGPTTRSRRLRYRHMPISPSSNSEPTSSPSPSRVLIISHVLPEVQSATETKVERPPNVEDPHDGGIGSGSGWQGEMGDMLDKLLSEEPKLSTSGAKAIVEEAEESALNRDEEMGVDADAEAKGDFLDAAVEQETSISDEINEATTPAETHLEEPVEEAIKMDVRMFEEQQMDCFYPDRPVDMRISTSTGVDIGTDASALLPTTVVETLTNFFSSNSTSIHAIAHQNPPQNQNPSLNHNSQNPPTPTSSPPQSITVDNIEYHLEADEELEIITLQAKAQTRAHAHAHSQTEAETDTAAQTTKISVSKQDGPVVVSHVKAVDRTLGIPRAMEYIQLEGQSGSTPPFLQELANLTREVAPSSGMLRKSIF